MGIWRRFTEQFSRSNTNTGEYEFPAQPPAPVTRGPEPVRSTTLGDTIDASRRARSDHNWTEAAWDAYRDIPEVRATVDWLTNAMSRVRLYAGSIPDDGGEPQPLDVNDPDNEPLIQPVRELFGGPLHQARMLGLWYLYRLVAGQCIIAAVEPTPEERIRYAILDEWLWMIRDASPVSGALRNRPEITLTWETPRGRITRTFDPDKVPDDIVFYHYRYRDPRSPERVDAPMRAALDDAELLRNVADSLNALAMSRIGTAPMIAVSSDVTIPGFGGPHAPEGEDPVLAGLVDTMGQRVDHRRDPISRTPMVFRTSIRSDKAPIGNAIEVLDTSVGYDERTLDVLNWAAKRVATAFSAPAEVANGSSDPNHWNALYEGLDGARIVIAPAAAELCLLVQQLWCEWRMAKRKVPVDQIKRTTIWYDTSALVQDPDRSATLIELRRTDPSLVTAQEVRRAAGLPSEPEEPDMAPTAGDDPDTDATTTTGQVPRINGVTPAVPTIPGSGPVIRSPGFPTAGSRRA